MEHSAKFRKYAMVGDLYNLIIMYSQDAYTYRDFDEAFLLAVETGHFEMVVFLVEHGADIHISDDYPIQAASENGHLNIVQYLVEPQKYGASDNVHSANINTNYGSPISLASENGHLDIVKYLVKHGADANDSSLRMASSNGHLEVVKILVEPQKYGADDNVQGVNIHIDNDEALQLAAEYNHLEVVKYLIERGIQLDDPYREFTINALNEVLLWAIENNNLEMVIVSVESQKYGVNDNVHGADIESALEAAEEKEHLKIVDYLNEYIRTNIIQ